MSMVKSHVMTHAMKQKKVSTVMDHGGNVLYSSGIHMAIQFSPGLQVGHVSLSSSNN